ncbi:MFS transporter [Saccharomonospora cyanea]|uniref:Drug resistance transporter, EmrB/QacA subfamily n=1 Tax=Saccharomonospora cyanea NA-134 TaxID=882082 RepID=H5XNB1_9PSEU|nr:MFS transporter [Saccharomonospora cyanea]EHR63744.1 drug resistance transporter, EmrB/QacA subfamily [Saccharomonospora cyanea NA-134]
MEPSTIAAPSRTRWLALTVLCAGALMAIVDETIVAVSLPAIQSDLGFTQAGASWITGAYLVAFAGLLLLAGRLGDLVGRRRVFLAGLAGFTVSSALCGLAWNPAVLVAARFVQGIGAAAMTAVLLGMIVTLFGEPGERAKAVGAFSFVQASGGTIGMLVGGLVTEALSWHWIFYLNVPVGVLAFPLALRVLPTDEGTRTRQRLDVPGAVLVTGGFATGIYAITRLEQPGGAGTFALGVVAAALLGGFALRQKRATTPLLPLRLLRSRRLVGANAVLLLLVAAMFGFMFLTVLTMQRVLFLDARQAGLAMVPVSVAIAVLSLGVTPRLNTRFGERTVLPAGLIVIAGGLTLLANLPADAGYASHLLPALTLLGVGFGLAMPSLMSLGMAEATPQDSGAASGLFNTTQQVGGALGLSTLLVVAAAHTDERLAGGAPERLALLDGYRLAFGIGVGLVLTALAVALLLGRRPRPA